MAIPSVKNLIFDLGGVILDLSVEDTLTAFSKLSGIEQSKVTEIFISSPEFELYEKGSMNDQEFRHFVRNVYKTNATDIQLDIAWNAMLKGLPKVKLDLLEALKESYRVFLLSNTNGIHLHHINEIILKGVTGENDLDRYFHRAYYSHRMGKRKPDAEIFEQVLDENNLKAEDTLFLDDNAFNVKGAESVGIKTVYVTSPNLILELFNG